MGDGAPWLAAASVAEREEEGAAMSAEDLYSSVCRLQDEDQATETALRATQKNVEQLQEAIAARTALMAEEEQRCLALQQRLEELCSVRRAHELAHVAACRALESLRTEVHEMERQLMRDYGDSLQSTLPLCSSPSRGTADGQQDGPPTMDMGDRDACFASVATVMSMVHAVIDKLHAVRDAQAASARNTTLTGEAAILDDSGDASGGAASNTVAVTASSGRRRVTFDESCIETVTPVEAVNANRARCPVYLPFELPHTVAAPPPATRHVRPETTPDKHRTTHVAKRSRQVVQAVTEEDVVAAATSESTCEACDMVMSTVPCPETTSAGAALPSPVADYSRDGVTAAGTVAENFTAAAQHSSTTQRGAVTTIVLPFAAGISRRTTRPRKTVWRLPGAVEW